MTEPQVTAKYTGPVGSSNDLGPIAVQILLDPDMARTLDAQDDAILGSLVRIAASQLLAAGE